MKRTHHCGELRSSDVGQPASLIGWVDAIRDHGGILFLDLRDREGVTQIKTNPSEADPALAATLERVRPESVVEAAGVVVRREGDTVNPNLPTGEVEIDCASLKVHSVADTPPFPIDDEKGQRVQEDLRLKYRYLDLRRPRMRRMLGFRHRVNKAARDYMDELGFYEVETPLLFKSTPEGAREYLVPSRVASTPCRSPRSSSSRCSW